MLFGKYINKYYFKYWFLFLIGIAALVAVDIAQMYEPEYLGAIVDHLSGEGPVDTAFITSICGNVMIVAGVMFGGRMIWRYTLFNASQRIEAGLRKEMFLKSERLSQKYYHETKVGSIMSWFTTDLETVEEFCGFGTVQLVDAFFMGVLVIVKMIMLDYIMALLALIPMILIIVWGALVEKFMAAKWEARQKEYDRLYDYTQENFTGIRVIKAFVRESWEIHSFAKAAKRNKDANISFVRVSVFFDVVIEVLIALILSLIIGFGSWFVYAFAAGTPIEIFGHTVDLTAGNLITFIGYFDLLIWPMIALGSLITMYSRARTSLKRVTVFLDAEEDVKDPEDPKEPEKAEGRIEFKDLTFNYPGKDREVLKNVSFTVESGETVGVVGRIGSGKTTLANVLLRLYNLEPGSLYIDGVDIMDMKLETVRELVALAPQDNFLFSDTVGNNISFGLENASDEMIKDAAEFADVASNIEDFTDKYDTVMGERGVTLSGGQKQRISVARAYLRDAPVLILDDSVSAVDVKTEEKMLENIRNKRAGKTTIVIASRVSTVSKFGRILVMNEGQVEAFDTPARLMEISPTYRKMVYLQELEKEVSGGES